MRTTLLVLFLLAAWFPLASQSVPTATEPHHRLWAGGEFSDFNPDYSCSNNMPFACSKDLLGFGAVAEFDLNSRLGAEGEARWLHWHGVQGQKESSYLIGPSYKFWSHNSSSARAKFLIGDGRITVPQLSASVLAYAPGAELTYLHSRKIAYFVDYEYQFWPSFAGPPTVSSTGQLVPHNHGLSPNGFSFGLKYNIF